ncbi:MULTISPECIES: hypothetical protein [unclassified Microcoleus]
MTTPHADWKPVQRGLRQRILDEMAAAQGQQKQSGNFKHECDRP